MNQSRLDPEWLEASSLPALVQASGPGFMLCPLAALVPPATLAVWQEIHRRAHAQAEAECKPSLLKWLQKPSLN